MKDEPSYDDCPDRGNVESLNLPRWSDDFDRRRELELRKLCREFRRRNLSRLKALGIVKAIGGYSGVEGEGSMHDVECVGADSSPVQIPDDLRHQLIQFLYEFAPDNYESTDGGQGDVTLNLQTKRIEVEHEQAVIQTKNYYDEYKF
jgi:hypothetical protein